MASFKRETKEAGKNFERLVADMKFKAQAGEFKHLTPVAIEETGIKAITAKENIAGVIGLYTGETITAVDEQLLPVTTQVIIGKTSIPVEDLGDMEIATLKKVGVYVVEELEGTKEA